MEMKDYTIEVCLAVAELDGNDRLFAEKSAALISFGGIVAAYQKQFFDNRLIPIIFAKKLEFIKAATTKAALKEILEPAKFHYDGNKIHSVGSYSLEEEELLHWSLASLKAPPNGAAFDRMMMLMEKFYP